MKSYPICFEDIHEGELGLFSHVEVAVGEHVELVDGNRGVIGTVESVRSNWPGLWLAWVRVIDHFHYVEVREDPIDLR